MRPLKLIVRALGRDAGEHAVDLASPGAARRPFLVPARLGPLRFADALRAALDGPHGIASGPGGVEVALELEVAGETWRVWRCWREGAPRDALSLLGRPTGPSIHETQVLAEGAERVGSELARLLAATGPPALRLIAPWAELLDLLASAPDAPDGRANDVHARVARDVDPVARHVGGRIRDLLHGAHEVLRDGTEKLAPEGSGVLTPDEMSALREDLVGTLARASASSSRLRGSASEAGRVAAAMRTRHELAQGHARGEDVLRRLELRRNLMDANRRRLQRARSAAEVEALVGLKEPTPDAGRINLRVRERAEEALREALDAARRTRSTLGAEEARAGERRALREWIDRLAALRGAVARLAEAGPSAREAEARAGEWDRRVREAGEALARVRQEREQAQLEVTLVSEGPARTQALHDEANAAAQRRDVALDLQAAREALRQGAKELQVAKLAVEQADEGLEAARRELDYRSRSPVPSPGPAPSLAPLLEERERLSAVAASRAEELASARDRLRALTTTLGSAAYLSPELLAAEAREKADAARRWGTSGRTQAVVEADVVRLLADEAERTAWLVQAEAERGRACSALLEARALLAERESAVAGAHRTPHDLETAIAEARRELAARDEALAAATSLAEAADAALAEREAALRSAQDSERSARGALLDLGGPARGRLRDAGFASWEELEEARLPAPEMEALAREVAEDDAVVNEATERVRVGREPAVLPRVDPEQTDRLHALVADALARASGVEERAARDLAFVDAALDALDVISAELDALEDASGLAATSGLTSSGTFEQRAREGILRRLLARGEGHLARWQAPWSLRWEGQEDGPTALGVRDAESDAAVDLSRPGRTSLLAMALAMELAMLHDERGSSRAETLFVDAIPEGLSEAEVDAVLAALGALAAEGRAIALPCDPGPAWDRIASRLVRAAMAE